MALLELENVSLSFGGLRVVWTSTSTFSTGRSSA